MITLYNPFESSYNSGDQLEIALGYGKNPISEVDVDQFKIITYTVIDQQKYKVDEGSSEEEFTPQGGKISKYDEVQVSSLVTYERDVQYTFQVKLDHAIPQNGFLRMTLPSEVSISSNNMIRNSCELPDLTQLSCSIEDSETILVKITTPAFTNGFTDISQPFIFSAQGFRNPRSTKESGLFYFQSQDEDGFNIDKSTDSDYFSVQMEELSEINSVRVDILNNQTNGVVTNYRITIGVNTPIKEGDRIEIPFPDEVQIQNDFKCSVGNVVDNIQSLQCSKSGSNGIVVTLEQISNINANDEISFKVDGVRNPYSTEPSSPFTNVKILTSSQNGVSRYTNNDAKVQTQDSAYIHERQLSQSNKNPREIALYTLQFQTNSPIPRQAAIIINAPDIISLETNSNQCYVIITQSRHNVCDIDKSLIKIEGAFTYLASSYVGQVQIVFRATNPADNTNLQSLEMRIFSDKSYSYRIDKIENGLSPSLQCNYPCRLCDNQDPDYCTDCFDNDASLPNIIQSFSSNNTQTCSYSCREGFTTNGSESPKRCQTCHRSCDTCEDNNQKGDDKKCKRCSDSYPLYYKPTQECLQECKGKTYQCGRNQCCDCQEPCLTCQSASICDSCYENSLLPLLQFEQCVDKCYSGYVAQNFKCVTCESPCSTCEGSTTSCLSCDNESERQFLFGRNCVSQCPNGTVLDLEIRKCTGCKAGCERCDDEDNSKCLKCENNLALFENECLINCPFNHVKSKDGSTCELRDYLLDESFVYFPFLISGVFVFAIIIASYCFTKGKSLIISNFIALLSFLEVATVIYQSYDAYQRDYLPLALSSIAVYFVLLGLNVLFLIYYCCRLQFSDISFYYWRQEYTLSVALIMFLTTTVSLKLVRLLYSQLFGLNIFNASIEEYATFFKAIKVFSIISIFTFTLPLIAVDFLVILFLEWGTQLYITMIESALISILSAILILFEHCYCDLWKQMCKRKQKPLKPKNFYDVIDQSSSGVEIHKGDNSERNIRANLLKNILSTVRNNQKLKINNKFDDLISYQSDQTLMRRSSSMPDMTIIHSTLGEDERKIISYPGSPSDKNVQEVKVVYTEFYKKKVGDFKRSQDRLLQEFTFDNVYAESIPTKQTYQPQQQIKTKENQLTNKSKESSSEKWQKQQIKQSLEKKQTLDEKLLQSSGSKSENESVRNIQTSKQKVKRQNTFYTQIDEQDNEDLLSENGKYSKVHSQEQIKINEESMNQEQSQQQDKHQQLKQEELNQEEQQNAEQQEQQPENLTLLQEIPSQRIFQKRPSLQDEYFNQRSFNINEIMGNFTRNEKGEIIDQEIVIQDNNCKDLDGKLVNEQGYLIDEESGDIINKYTFNRMFRKQDLDSIGQIPLPFRFEQYNFNPHEIIGNFDFDRNTNKPIILKNKKGQLVDKNMRLVNKGGLLVDEHGNIIDNQGRIKFIKEQLNDKQELPRLFNYRSNRYNIRDIIGTFEKDNSTKQIKIKASKEDNKQAVDKLSRRVNMQGYLIDEKANIINHSNKIIFKKKELLFNEPPKIFTFTNFDINWVQGKYEIDESGNPILQYNEDEKVYEDNEGRLVNGKGYLIDDDFNIIDSEQQRIVLHYEYLENDTQNNIKNVEIPKVFRQEQIRQKKQQEINQQQQEEEEEEKQTQNEIEQIKQSDIQEQLQQKKQVNKSKPPLQKSRVINKPQGRTGQRMIQAFQKNMFAPLQQRAKSQQRIRPTNKPTFDYKVHPQKEAQQQQETAFERLGQLANSIGNLNNTTQISLPSEYNRNDGIHSLGRTELLSNQNELGQVKRNGFINDNNEQYSQQELGYQEFIHDDVDSKASRYNAKSSKQPNNRSQSRRIRQNESNLDKIYEQDFTVDNQEEDDNDSLFQNDKFNLNDIERNPFGQRLDLLSQFKGNNQRTKKHKKKVSDKNTVKDLEKIYNQRMQLPKNRDKTNNKSGQNFYQQAIGQHIDRFNDGDNDEIFDGRRQRKGSMGY